MLQKKKARPAKKWVKTSHKRKKAALIEFIKRTSRKPKKIMPAHSYLHQLNVAKVARWYLGKIGASTKAKNLGEFGALGHDIVRQGKGHGLDSAKIMGNLLKEKIGKRSRGRITGAMVKHGMPAIKNGKRMPSDPVSDAVFFGDRIEATGAYGVFRVSVSNGELPERIRAFQKIVLNKTNRIKGFNDLSITKQKVILAKTERNAKINLIIQDCKNNIMFDENPGFYKNGKPIDTLPAEKYFPKEVLPTLKRYDAELKEFISGLEQKKPWALEIAEPLFAEGFKGQKEFEQILADFKPKTIKASQFKKRALEYLKGKI